MYMNLCLLIKNNNLYKRKVIETLEYKSKSIEYIVDALNKLIYMNVLSCEYAVVCLENANDCDFYIIGIGNKSHVDIYFENISAIIDAISYDNMYFIHNHPGGIPNQSDDDIDATNKFINFSKENNLEFIESIVIASGGWNEIISGNGLFL